MNTPLGLILQGIYIALVIIIFYFVYEQVGGITAFAIGFSFVTANLAFYTIEKNIIQQKEVNLMMHQLIKQLEIGLQESKIENKATALTTQMLFDIMDSTK